MESTLLSPDDLTRSKLCNLSFLAGKQLSWGQGSGKTDLILDGKRFDGAAVTKILKAMVNNDIHRPTPLTVEGLRLSSFDDLVAMYKMAESLWLHRGFKGNDLRAKIIEGIKEAPLSFRRFVQIIEELHFDTGLTRMAKHHVMYGQVKGGRLATPEIEEIRQYCLLHNSTKRLWTEMEAIRVDIRQKMENQTRRNAEQKAVVKRSTFNPDFPALPTKKK